MLELRAKDRAEATILDHILGTFLSEFVKDVAQETLRAGLQAKRRAEDEVTRDLRIFPNSTVQRKRCTIWKYHNIHKRDK